MAWTSKDLDPQAVSAAVLSAVDTVVPKAGPLSPSQEPKVEATDISEYNGGLRCLGLDKMANTCYISVVNLYLNQGDLERRKAKGALVIYLEIESASKFFQAVQLPFSSDEDDASMMAACGQLAQKIAEAFKSELTGRGFASLVLSPARNYKNNVDGIEFSTDQKTKHEISFFYLKHKSLAIDLTLAPIPKK